MWKDSHRTSTKYWQISDFHEGKRISMPLSRTKEKGERSRTGPALPGASCAGGQVSASPRKTRGARPARRGLGPRPAARPAADTHLDAETPVSLLRYREAWGWLRADTVVHHTEGVREDARAHQQSKAPLPGAQREMCATAAGASFSRQGTTHPLLRKFPVRLSLPSRTPELAGAAAASLGECMGPGAWTPLKTDRGQHVLRKETASLQTKNSPHAKNVLNPHKLHRGAHAYKQLSKTTVDNCFP